MSAEDPGLLASFGIRVADFFAGTAGGLVGVLFDDKAGLKIWLTYAFGGGLVANFLLTDAMHLLPPGISSGGAGFFLGVCAPIVVGTLKVIARKWNGSA
jgi:hypothetical protein